MACSTRNPDRKIPTPITVAKATPPTTTKVVSRTTERTDLARGLNPDAEAGAGAPLTVYGVLEVADRR